MDQDKRKGGREINGLLVRPGEIIVTCASLPLFTILGRAVAVCLWDSKMHFAGMCCFTHPHISDPSKATGKYGNVAVLKLISMFKEFKNSDKIEAQIFGGAKKNEKDSNGEKNIAIAKKILNSKQIPIVSEDIGGLIGRKILFDVVSGQAAVLKVKNIRKEDWEND